MFTAEIISDRQFHSLHFFPHRPTALLVGMILGRLSVVQQGEETPDMRPVVSHLPGKTQVEAVRKQCEVPLGPSHCPLPHRACSASMSLSAPPPPPPALASSCDPDLTDL